jgi:hypothetical protein
MSEAIRLADLYASVDPRYGTVISEGTGEHARVGLIVIAHEYAPAEQQRSIFMQLEYVLSRPQRTVVLMEGFSGEGKSRGGNAAVEDSRDRAAAAMSALAREGALASDVILRLHPENRRFHGIDDSALLATMAGCVRGIEEDIRSAIPVETRENIDSDSLFRSCFEGLYRPILDFLEDRVTNKRLRNLIAARRAFLQEGKTTVYAHSLASAAADARIGLEDYPSVQALSQAVGKEGSVNFGKSEEERSTLIKTLETLGERSDPELRGWLNSVSTAEAVMEALMREEMNLPPAERDKWVKPCLLLLEPRETEDPLPEWLNSLRILALALRVGAVSEAFYYARLKDLFDILGLPISRSFKHFAGYLAYVELAGRVDKDRLLEVELPSLYEEIAERFSLSPPDNMIVRLQRELDDMEKIVRLRMNASRVEAALGKDLSLLDWLHAALEIVRAVAGKEWFDDQGRAQFRPAAGGIASLIDGVIPKARDFYSFALRRSQKIGENALRHDLQGSSLATLVCGRFHLPGLSRVFSSAGHAAWIVVGPKGGDWAFPETEIALSPGITRDNGRSGMMG